MVRLHPLWSDGGLRVSFLVYYTHTTIKFNNTCTKTGRESETKRNIEANWETYVATYRYYENAQQHNRLVALIFLLVHLRRFRMYNQRLRLKMCPRYNATNHDNTSQYLPLLALLPGGGIYAYKLNRCHNRFNYIYI